MPERIHLRTGACILLSALCLLLIALAAMGIATAASPWIWKGPALLLLAAACWGIHRQAMPTAMPGAGDLYMDGTATDAREGESVHLVYTGHAWISRWVSVIYLHETDTGKSCNWLVCAANNHPDDYRRMLGYLRLSSCAEGQGAES